MADDDARSRQARLSLLQRRLAGKEARSALHEQLTVLSGSLGDPPWRILDLEQSDELRDHLLNECRQQQSTGSVVRLEEDNSSIFRSQVRNALAKVARGDPVLVHFQQSDTVGLVEAPLDFIAQTAVDLLKFDGDNVLLAPRDARWGLLLDRTVEADGQERFELESWGLDVR